MGVSCLFPPSPPLRLQKSMQSFFLTQGFLTLHSCTIMSFKTTQSTVMSLEMRQFKSCNFSFTKSKGFYAITANDSNIVNNFNLSQSLELLIDKYDLQSCQTYDGRCSITYSHSILWYLYGSCKAVSTNYLLTGSYNTLYINHVCTGSYFTCLDYLLPSWPTPRLNTS